MAWWTSESKRVQNQLSLAWLEKYSHIDYIRLRLTRTHLIVLMIGQQTFQVDFQNWDSKILRIRAKCELHTPKPHYTENSMLAHSLLNGICVCVCVYVRLYTYFGVGFEKRHLID